MTERLAGMPDPRLLDTSTARSRERANSLSLHVKQHHHLCLRRRLQAVEAPFETVRSRLHGEAFFGSHVGRRFHACP